MTFTVLDLFSGCGGIHLGLEATGRFRTIAFCENDASAAATLSTRWPMIMNFGDIRKLRDPPLVDVIAGGFPCQDISNGNALHGSTLGLSGKRSGLWFQMLRLITAVRPRGVLIENVAVLRKRGLKEVLHGLAEIGYDAEWYTVPASAVGAPHKRERLYVIAYRQREGMEGLGSVFNFGAAGSWRWRGAEDLHAIASAPFVSSDRWPRPLVRRMDDGLANRAHRLKQIGNSVVVPVITQLGHRLATELTQLGHSSGTARAQL